MLLKRKGFTLIELLVVIIIVGILASVAIPVITGNVTRAKKTEAVTALGTLKTALTAYKAEYGAYPATAAIVDYANLGLTNTDFDGKYYINSGYSWTNVATPLQSYLTANASAVSSINVVMYMNGTITGDRN